MPNVSSTAAILTADTVALEKGLAKGLNSINQFVNQSNASLNRLAGLQAATALGGGIAKTIAGMFGVASVSAVSALASLKEKIASKLEDIEDVVKKAAVWNLDPSSFQALAVGFKSSSGDISGALKHLSRSITEAESGSASARFNFAMLGVSLETLKSQSPDQQLLSIAQGLNSISDANIRASVAFELLGRGSEKLIEEITQGRQAFEDNVTFGQRYGLILSNLDISKINEARNAWENVGRASEGTINTLVASVAPSLQGIGEIVLDAIGGILPVIKDVGEVVNDIFMSLKDPLQSIINIITKIVQIVSSLLKPIFLSLKPVFDAIGTVFGFVFDKIAKGLEVIGDVIKWIIEKVTWVINKIRGFLSTITFGLVSAPGQATPNAATQQATTQIASISASLQTSTQIVQDVNKGLEELRKAQFNLRVSTSYAANDMLSLASATRIAEMRTRAAEVLASLPTTGVFGQFAQNWINGFNTLMDQLASEIRNTEMLARARDLGEQFRSTADVLADRTRFLLGAARARGQSFFDADQFGAALLQAVTQAEQQLGLNNRPFAANANLGGSAGAFDAILRNQTPQLSLQERIARIQEESKRVQEQIRDYTRDTVIRLDRVPQHQLFRVLEALIP